MENSSTILSFALMLATVAAQAEIYKCPGKNGEPLFTSSYGAGCKAQAVNPVIPSETEVAAAKAYNERREREEKEAQAAYERERESRLKEEGTAAAARQKQAAKEQARALDQKARVLRGEKIHAEDQGLVMPP